MKIVIDAKDFSKVLKQFKGAYAQIWLFNISHKRIALRLSLPNVANVIYIVAAGCEHITGSFSWKNANLSIIEDIDKETMQPIFRIIDEAADFQITASSGVALASGPTNDVDISFEKFLDDKV